MEKTNIRIILAPLQGFTDVTFRNVFAAHFEGVDEAVAPFIATMGNRKLKSSRLKDVNPGSNLEIPVVPQILGNHAEDFIFLARRLHDMGHERINWNLGCPHDRVARKKRGSGLLSFPEDIDCFLDAVLPAIPNSLSIKIRLGREDANEIFDLLPVLDRYPLDEIILHPRTGRQMYNGRPDHQAFGRVTAKSRHDFVYNGDITDLTSFQEVRRKFPNITRFMIGRGLLADPLLGETIKGIRSPADRIQRLKAFHDDLFASYRTLFSGPGHLIGRMKGFWSFPGPFKNDRKALKSILKSDCETKYRDAVDRLFDLHHITGS